MAFGLPVPATASLAMDAAPTRQRQPPHVPWSSFEHYWLLTCEHHFKHHCGAAHRSARSDFTHKWSAPTLTVTLAAATDTAATDTAGMTVDTAVTAVTPTVSVAVTAATYATVART